MKASRSKYALATAISVALVALDFGIADAKDAQLGGRPNSANAAANTSNATEVPAIIVTARRKDENAQRVPISIAVVDQQTLSENHVDNFGDLQHLVPSMSAVNSVFSRDTVNLSIRGQGATQYQGVPGVVAYLDEIPIPAEDSGDLVGGQGLLFDLENVQVLKGPQGTLFGRNSVGGDVLLQTARPHDAFGGFAEAGYGNYNNREFTAAVDTPLISGVLLTRTAFTVDARDGFTHLLSAPGIPNGLNVDDRDLWGARESIVFKPFEGAENDTVITFSGYRSHSAVFALAAVDPNGLFAAIEGPGAVTLAKQQQQLGPRTLVGQSVDPISQGHTTSVSNITRVDLSNDLKFRNIFGFVDATYVSTADVDSTTFRFLDLVAKPWRAAVRQFSEEPQLQGKSFGGRLDWTVGLFYLDAYSPNYMLLTQQIFGLPYSYEDYKTESRSTAVYGQGTYDLSSWINGLSLVAGVRETSDEESRTDRSADPADPTPSNCAATPRVNCSSIYKNKARATATTYTFGVNYQVSPKDLLYFTTRRGYRLGGYNLDAGTPAGVIDLDNYAPEYVTDYELGLKSDWKLGTIPVRTNADFYYQDYDNIQLTQSLFIPALNRLDTITNNAGTARQWGFEFETWAKLTPELQLGVTYDYLNFKYTRFARGTDVARAFEYAPIGRPANKYSIDLKYTRSLPQDHGEVVLQGHWAWQDNSDIKDQPGTEIKAYGLLNLGADWNRIEGSNVDLNFYVTNALDKLYLVGNRPLWPLGVTSVMYGEPRMYGFRMKYHF